MGKARAHRISYRNNHCIVRPVYMETVMTELESVLLIALSVVWWAYRLAERRARYFSCALVAVGLNEIKVIVDEKTRTYKLEEIE